MLARLGVDRSPATAGALLELQRAWTFTQPFHNLDLLAGFAAGRPPLGRRDGWLRCVQGLGGPCHVQASSFLVLLRSLGFDAHFAGARITHPGDHLVVCVHVEGETYVCDVGNGHPYPAPFPIRGIAEQTHLGWSVRSSGSGRQVVVEQQTPGAAHWRKVYTASAEPRTWADFETAISHHHSSPGFGPFLRGLRAVRVRADHAITLRDDVLTRHQTGEVTVEVLSNGHESALINLMKLGDLPVHEAVATWRVNTGRC